mmetsp:Transcript_12824/g.17730  ORF Transcript_12824/g.17730 Transcript_12824/m.17730 type:complete len:336 (+) Transcript_12824:40-1047(+)
MPIRPIIMKGHTRPITQVRYNYDGDLIFSSSKDKVVTCWRSDTGDRLGTYDGHKGAIYSLDVDRKSTLVATGASDSSARLWDAETGKELAQFEVKSNVRYVKFSLGDRMLLAAQDKQFGSQPTAFIYDVAGEGKESFSPNPNPRASFFVEGNKENILSALWADLNRSIITAHEDGILRKWDVETQKIIKEVGVFDTNMNSIAYSKDETMIVASSPGDHCAKLLDSKSLKIMKTYQSNRPINAAAVSPIYNQVLIGGGIQARDVALVDSRMSHFEVDFWHICYQFYMGSAKGHFGPVNSIDIHPNGKSFVSGGEEGEIRLHHLDQVYIKSSNQMDL